MRKEILFAVIAGIIFGIIVAFGIWRANSALNSKSTSTSKETLDVSPTLTPQEFNLSLAKPEEDDVISETPMILSGVTTPSAWVVISAEDEDYVSSADESGAFSQEVNLLGGVNNLTVFAIDVNSKSAEKQISVVFSSEFAKDAGITPEASDSSVEQASEESDAVREKVKEKVELVRKNPKAYMGTITDKTTDSLQIKTDGGEIQQAQVDETTSFVKFGKTSTKVKFDDVAIGDYTIAMGFRDSSGVLDARRILLTSPGQPIKKQVLFGTVSSVTKDSITMQDKLTNQEYEIKSGKDLLVTLSADAGLAKSKFSEIGQGDSLIAAALLKDGSLEIRRIHIVSSTPKETP